MAPQRIVQNIQLNATTNRDRNRCRVATAVISDPRVIPYCPGRPATLSDQPIYRRLPWLEEGEDVRYAQHNHILRPSHKRHLTEP